MYIAGVYSSALTVSKFEPIAVKHVNKVYTDDTMSLPEYHKSRKIKGKDYQHFVMFMPYNIP